MWVTKGGFLHKKYYRTFFQSDEQFVEIRQFVDEHATGEDILMDAVYNEYNNRSKNCLYFQFTRYVESPKCREGGAQLSQTSAGYRPHIIRNIFNMHNGVNPFPILTIYPDKMYTVAA